MHNWLNILVLLFAFGSKLPAPYPYALSLDTSETTPGGIVNVTISAPSGEVVKLTADDLETTLPQLYVTDTYVAQIHIPLGCVCRGVVRTVRLWINGVDVYDVHLRVSGYSVWLPAVVS